MSLLYHAKAAGTDPGPDGWPAEGGWTYPGPPWPPGWEHEELPGIATVTEDEYDLATTTGSTELGDTDTARLNNWNAVSTSSRARMEATTQAASGTARHSGDVALVNVVKGAGAWGPSGSCVRSLSRFDLTPHGSISALRLQLPASAASTAEDEGPTSPGDATYLAAQTIKVVNANGAIVAGTITWADLLVPGTCPVLATIAGDAWLPDSYHSLTVAGAGAPLYLGFIVGLDYADGSLPAFSSGLAFGYRHPWIYFYISSADRLKLEVTA